MSRILLLCLLALPSMSLFAAPFTALSNGESYTYKVSWGIFPGAGEITIAAHEENTTDGLRTIVVVTTRTRGLASALYSYDNKATATIDTASGRILDARDIGEDSKRKYDSETRFDYAARSFTHTDRIKTERSGTQPLPDGDPIDLISCLIGTRFWEIKPTERRDALVYFGRDTYAVTLSADSYETIKTPLGRFNTLLLIPRMEKNPKGLFKRGGEIKVWISQEKERLPVKMQLKLNFGTATLSLIKHTRTSAAPAAPAANPAAAE